MTPVTNNKKGDSHRVIVGTCTTPWVVIAEQTPLSDLSLRLGLRQKRLRDADGVVILLVGLQGNGKQE
jgi:hypothetical protein